jgi:hypothetical protein
MAMRMSGKSFPNSQFYTLFYSKNNCYLWVPGGHGIQFKMSQHSPTGNTNLPSARVYKPTLWSVNINISLKRLKYWFVFPGFRLRFRAGRQVLKFEYLN